MPVVGGTSSARRMMSGSAVEQAALPPTSQRSDRAIAAVGGTSSERRMINASAVVTSPLPLTSPHWQSSPMPAEQVFTPLH